MVCWGVPIVPHLRELLCFFFAFFCSVLEPSAMVHELEDHREEVRVGQVRVDGWSAMDGHSVRHARATLFQNPLPLSRWLAPLQVSNAHHQPTPRVAAASSRADAGLIMC